MLETLIFASPFLLLAFTGLAFETLRVASALRRERRP
jgi:hypothetical protein